MTMIDLRERFEDADLIDAPDLWASVQAKATERPDRGGGRLRDPRPSGPPNERRLIARKVMTLAAAFLIAAVGIGIILRAFRPSTTPLHQPPTPQNGRIVFGVQGGNDSNHLFTVNPDGTDVRDLSVDSPCMSWAPDGSKILFSSNRGGNLDDAIDLRDGRADVGEVGHRDRGRADDRDGAAGHDDIGVAGTAQAVDHPVRDERTLKAGTLLICDGVAPVALAGVMGGLESEVTDATNAHFPKPLASDLVEFLPAVRWV